MTPEERFYTALIGDLPDYIPMIIWNNKLPGGDVDNQLLDLGVCVIVKSSVWNQTMADIPFDFTETAVADGTTILETTYQTEAGDIKIIQRLMPGTIWVEKYPFSGDEDYDALECLISSRTYDADFERFIKDDQRYGDQSIARPVTIHSPMHELIYEFMGLEQFSIQYAENRVRLLQLLEILKQDWQKRVEMVAASPAKFAVIEGNTVFHVVGEDRFHKYYLPCIEEACEILHARGIYAGAHLDGNNRDFASLIASTSLDFIESFTPPPDCDLTIADARKSWPDKTLLVHFPSSVHLSGVGAIEAQLKEILKHAHPGNRIVVGVSEDVPYRGIKTLAPLFQYLSKNGKLPIKDAYEGVHLC